MILIRERNYELDSYWQPWFAWRPVYVHRLGLVWLETVARKLNNLGPDLSYWEYQSNGSPAD